MIRQLPSRNSIKARLDSTKYILRKRFIDLKDPLIAEAKELTSGTIPTRTIKPKRPFAKKNADHRTVVAVLNGSRQRVRLPNFKGGGVFPLLPINKQKGKLRSSLATKITQVGEQTFLELISRVRYGKYILAKQGTSKMISRSFQQRINNKMRRYSVHE